MDRINLHDFNITDFMDVLADCKGNVYMVTPEGDRLNLKSTLCQLIGIARLLENGRVAHAVIECELPEDERKLFRFNLFGEKYSR